MKETPLISSADPDLVDELLAANDEGKGQARLRLYDAIEALQLREKKAKADLRQFLQKVIDADAEAKYPEDSHVDLHDLAKQAAEILKEH